MTVFGTLGTEQLAPANLADLRAAGFTVAMVEANWHNGQQGAQGLPTASYTSDLKARIAAMKAAGFRLTLEKGEFNLPAWATTLASTFYHRTHTGATTWQQLNLTWSAAARGLWQSYVDQLHSLYDLRNFDAIRIGSGSDVELLYPSASYWVGFDAAAQTGVGLAANQVRCPYPGLKPGAMTPAQAQVWLDWYVKSLANTAIWQMNYLRSKGFAGTFEVLMPGQGVQPGIEAQVVGRGLPLYGPLSRGAVWQKIANLLPPQPGIRFHLSSVGDQSGQSADNLPQASDATVSLTDPSITNWSATRWVASLAKRYGFPVSMENVGYSTGYSHYSDLSATGLVAETFAAVDAIKPDVLYWAHANQLFGAGHLAPLSRAVGPAVTARAK